MKPRVAITLGDPAGIGPEIVSKAVRDPRVLAACEPVIVGDPVALALHHQPLPSVDMLSIPGLAKKIHLGKPSQEAGQSAIDSVKKAAGLIETRQVSAMVTAPASKISLQAAGLKFPGHTEWLLHAYGKGTGAMLMVAGSLRALLITRHVPLAHVVDELTPSDIVSGATYANTFVRRILKKKIPRLGLCGLNPHAGDGGLLGKEEHTIMEPALRTLKKRGIAVQGPLSADSAFRDAAGGAYDVLLAAYHDQGMIPLKVHAPDRLVNITLGLPFIRTAPGHGTAYDIAGKNRADAGPMIEAVCLAARYSPR